MRAIRRTVRTAALATGTLAALALPAHAAMADSPAPGADQQVADQQQPGTENKGEVLPEVLPGEDDVKPEVLPEVKPETTPETEPDTGKTRAYVTTVKLADGSVAKVYQLGPDHFEAVLSYQGAVLDTLVSKDGRPAYGQNNGLHVVLQPNGTVTSWVEGGTKPTDKPKPQQPKPHQHKRASVAKITMPDGRIAKLIKGAQGPRVELSMPNGNALGTLDLKHRSALNDGWTYKIVMDGKKAEFVVIDGKNGGSSWVYDFDGKLVEKYQVDRHGKKTAQAVKPVVKQAERTAVTPKGGVKAGAEGVEQRSSDTPVLVAAGGGMAAAGAAGLGFALLRRGRGQQG